MHDTKPTLQKSSPILKVASNEISKVLNAVIEMPGTLEEKGSYAGRAQRMNQGKNYTTDPKRKDSHK
jgi:hypothetical protein